jgi:hypothetical protein
MASHNAVHKRAFEVSVSRMSKEKGFTKVKAEAQDFYFQVEEFRP